VGAAPHFARPPFHTATSSISGIARSKSLRGLCLASNSMIDLLNQSAKNLAEALSAPRDNDRHELNHPLRRHPLWL